MSETMNLQEALTPHEDIETVLKRRDAFRKAAGIDYVRNAAVIMKTACESEGQEGTPTWAVYSKMAHHPTTDPGSIHLASIVYEALGSIHRQQKVASPALGSVWNTVTGVGSAAGAVPTTLLRSLSLLGIVGGAAAGGGMWGLNRALGKEDQKSRQLEIQRDTYRRLNAEVQAELRRRNLAPNPTNTAAVVDYLT